MESSFMLNSVGDTGRCVPRLTHVSIKYAIYCCSLKSIWHFWSHLRLRESQENDLS